MKCLFFVFAVLVREACLMSRDIFLFWGLREDTCVGHLAVCQYVGAGPAAPGVLSRSSSGTDPEVSSLPCLRVTLLSPVLVFPC